MKALVFERNLGRFAASRVASALGSGRGVAVGPLHLTEVDEPELPGPDWYRLAPRLAGICGSDLATLDGHSSRYFEEIVSFPFVPGHEIVADLLTELEPGSGSGRVVVEPVLSCAVRGIEPTCAACAAGHTGGCQRIAFGHIKPGLQTGYCTDTGGGWGGVVVAHASQLHVVPETMSDEAAVMVEPTACAIHAALRARVEGGDVLVVLGAGTLGLCTIAALRAYSPPRTLIVGAKHPDQKRLAGDLGADVVVAPSEVGRVVRRATHTMAVPAPRATAAPSSRLTGGADVVVDCVGSAASIAQALELVRPRGRVVLVGMPGSVRVDLAPLWHRELELVGAYAYGQEEVDNDAGNPAPVRTFDLAFELVHNAELGRLVSARYGLGDYQAAIAHAAASGARGATKVVFDLSIGARRRWDDNDTARRNK